MQGEKAGIATKVLNKKGKEINVSIIADAIEIGGRNFAEIIVFTCYLPLFTPIQRFYRWIGM